ncbi:hypothetical protein ACH5RR_011008 [Cinchona calisaya]|uniref:C3H1-type domain-containing protein n=1 Tax=Cinchona calisaya TaxID=153742 RepID=A0ABD3A7A3_9GENT
MGTYEDDSGVTSSLKLQPENPELGFSSADLVEKFENIGLHSNDNDYVGFNSDHNGFGGSDASSSVLPLRPYAGDCPHYTRTGFCKFGLTCRFNHPVKRTNLAVKDKEDWSSDKAGQLECKYYLTAGGCKYGTNCRYSHSKDESEIAPPELNFLGLPIRLEAKQCPYYMRTGSCGYGAQCVFHHPEPSSMGVQDLYQSSLNDKSMRQSGYSLGSTNIASALHLSEASQPDQAPWSSHPLSCSTFSYQNDYSSHMISNSVTQGMYRHTELDKYQAQEFSHQTSGHANLNPGANRTDMLEQGISVQVEEFPERPDQPECNYFMKTGDCKYKSACRFHHPKDHPTGVLSEKGLPLRPGRSICRFYERFGLCKFGRACLFDHPVNHGFPTVPSWPSSEPASAPDAGSASAHDAGYWAE